MRAGLARIAVPQQARNVARPKTYPAPTRGWITNENLALAQGGSARVLENWFPEFDGLRLRGGAAKAATIGADPVEAMFTYRQGGVEKFFAASDSDIYDISGLDPDTAPSAAVTGQTNGYYSATQIATSGGEFLYAVNEADSPQLYDGTSWTQITGASSPAITGVTTSLLRHAWVYRNRLFFAERDSLKAWYLPVESVGGAAADLSLAGVVKRGGHLLFGATWSLDAGDGVDDKCVFVTDAGEVALYEGADPSDATDWRLVGVYDITQPLGKNAHIRAGGDLLIATVDGIVPLSEVFNKDTAAISLSAVSRPIEPDWQAEAQARLAAYPWEVLKWADRNMAVVSLPHTTLSSPHCFVVNLQTGAWAKFTGWDIRSMGLFGDTAYFGDNAGSVFQMDAGGKDDTASYLAKVSYAFDHLGTPGAYKNATLARGIFRAAVDFMPKLSVAGNYNTTFPTAPSAASDGSLDGLWDTAVWDISKWDDGAAGGTVETVTTRWVSVTRAGYVLAPQVQVTVGNTVKPDARLIAFDLMYETGAMVT